MLSAPVAGLIWNTVPAPALPPSSWRPVRPSRTVMDPGGGARYRSGHGRPLSFGTVCVAPGREPRPALSGTRTLVPLAVSARPRPDHSFDSVSPAHP